MFEESPEDEGGVEVSPDPSIEASKTLVSDIVGVLEEDIALGLLHPRERLTEDNLTAQFGVKRHLVRQALVELQQFGIVRHVKNRGAVVGDMKPAEVVEIYAVRSILEAAAVDVMDLPLSEHVIERLISIQREHQGGVADKDYRRVFRANLLFHKCLFGACGNTCLSEIIENFSIKVHGVRSHSIMHPKYLEMACDEHWEIIEAAVAGNREMLRQLCKQHLEPSMKFYIETYEMRFPAHRETQGTRGKKSS